MCERQKYSFFSKMMTATLKGCKNLVTSKTTQDQSSRIKNPAFDFVKMENKPHSRAKRVLMVMWLSWLT